MSSNDWSYAPLDVDPRNNYLPPRYFVPKIFVDTDKTWAKIAPVAMLTDEHGEENPQRTSRIQMAYDDTYLYLHAHCEDASPKITNAAPASKDFWRQDHIEFRLATNTTDQYDQSQFIIAPDGQVFSNKGLDKIADALRARGWSDIRGWEVEFRISWASMGVAAPAWGSAIRGLVAHVKWNGTNPDFGCISAVELGFLQAERYAEFVFGGEIAAVQLRSLAAGQRSLPRGTSTFNAVLANTTDQPVSGRLIVTKDKGFGADGWSCATALTLAPGETAIAVPLELDRPQFYRYRFWFEVDAQARELAAVSLRAAAPAVDAAALNLQHPYLYFTPVRQAQIARKAKNPAFATFVRDAAVTAADLKVTHVVAPGEQDFDDEILPRLWYIVGHMAFDARTGLPSPSRRVFEMASADVKAIMQAAYDDHGLDDAGKMIMRSYLNGLLRRRDFYAAEDFAGVDLAPATKALLQKGVDKLGDLELRRLNHLLLGDAFPYHFGRRGEHFAMVGHLGELVRKFVVTHDLRLVETASRVVKHVDGALSPGRYTDLHPGGASTSLALAYDTFFPHIAEADRAAWRSLCNKFLQLHLTTARERMWNCTTIANANSVTNCGGGLLAMALLKERPQAAESLTLARKLIRQYIDYCWGPQGGCTEGVQYWEYGGANFLRFAYGLESVLGTDDGFLSHPSVVQCMNNIRVSLCNDGELHGVNDTVPVAMAAEIAFLVAGRFNDEFALWYGDHVVRVHEANEAAGRQTPGRPPALFALLFRPDVPECTAQPPLPTAYRLRDIQYSIIRSGENYDCVLDAGLKGSRPPYTHHNQGDTGAAFIDVRGERLIIDPGYYKDKPTMHTMPIIGGVYPLEPHAFVGEITDCVSRGDLRYIACDATKAYRGAASRVKRHLVMLGEEGLVMLDDIVAGPQTKVLTQYQAGGVTSDLGEGRSVLIEGVKAKLGLQLVTRAELKLTLHTERTFHDSHWGYHFAKCRWFPVDGEYTPDEMDPLVTVFLDATKRKARIAKCKIKDGVATISLPGGRKITFQYFDGQWRLDLAMSCQ